MDVRGLRDAGPSLPTLWAGRKPLIAHEGGGGLIFFFFGTTLKPSFL